MGKRGKRERKRRGAVRASGDRGRGRPRVASSRVCGPREMGHAAMRVGRKKRGRDSRRPDATRRAGWEKDGTGIEIGCRVVQEKFWGLGLRV